MSAGKCEECLKWAWNFYNVEDKLICPKCVRKLIIGGELEKIYVKYRDIQIVKYLFINKGDWKSEGF